MGKPKGVARAAKQLRREQAEQRNAATPDERRRINRPKPAKVETGAPAPVEIKPALAINIESARKPRPPAPPRPPAAAAAAFTTRRKRRKPTPPPKPAQKVVVTPKRITDGIKPNHAARAVSMQAVFLWGQPNTLAPIRVLTNRESSANVES